MLNLFINITIGVLSGVLTSAFLFVLYLFKHRVFDVWFENRLYKGVVLEGTWFGKRVKHYKSKKDEPTVHDELKIQMDLKQSGYKISGIFTAESMFAHEDTKEVYSNIYKIEGHMHDNYAVFEYHPLSRKRTGLGTFVLEVKNGGKSMCGNITFVEEDNMEIVTIEGAVLNRSDGDE